MAAAIGLEDAFGAVFGEAKPEEGHPAPLPILFRAHACPSAAALRVVATDCHFLAWDRSLSVADLDDLVAIREICKAIDVLVQNCGKKKMVEAIDLPPPELYRHVEDISGDELVKALQIKETIPRRKALLALEEKVITILSEQGYVSKDESSGVIENLADIFEEEDEHEVIEDGEVDEGDVHVKPMSRKPHCQKLMSS